jgi:mono/diheme cytochrome c family protein
MYAHDEPSRRRDVKPPLLLCLPLLVAAAHHEPGAIPTRPVAPADGQSLARVSCVTCHGIGRSETSPRSNAPPFEVIVNKEGLTAETLAAWLRGAHNYPREMDFYLREPEVRVLVDYMMTLRDPNYRRSPDW